MLMCTPHGLVHSYSECFMPCKLQSIKQCLHAGRRLDASSGAWHGKLPALAPLKASASSSTFA